jgi:hypothetical protein
MAKKEIDEIDSEDESPQSSRTMKIVRIIIKLIVAAMMYACWAGLLVKYFNLFLLSSFIGFMWTGYKELRANNFITMIFLLMGAILLNPLYPMYFNVAMQYTVYLILAILAFASAVFDVFKAPPNYEKTRFGS